MDKYSIINLGSLMFTKLMAIPYIFHPARLGEQHWLIVIIAVIIINGLTVMILKYLTGIKETENQLIAFIKKHLNKETHTEEQNSAENIK